MTYFIGNFFAEKEIQRWIQEANSSKYGRSLAPSSMLIVIGGVGVGKTYGVTKMCEDQGKTIHMIDSNSIENFKDAKDKLVKWTSMNVATQFLASQRSEQVVIIDAVETLLTMDRSFLHSFQKLLETVSIPYIPIILSVQTCEKKRVCEAFQGATVIELNTPNDTDVLLFLRKKSDGAISAELLSDIVDQACGNVSVALHMLEMEQIGKDQCIQNTQKNVSDNIDKISTLADVYMHNCSSAAYYVFCEDPWLHPLRFHENLVNEWSERKGIIAKKQKVYLSMMNEICTWDMMMSHFKGNDLQIPTEFIAKSVYHLKQLERKKSAKPPTDEFTKMFSHLSLEKKNQVATYDSEYESLGSYYKSIIDQIYRSKKSKKSFLENV